MATTPYRPYLVVYVAWHPEYVEGQGLAKHIYTSLTRDIQNPISRGIGIPVFFRSMALAGNEAPTEITLDSAEHCAVVILVDNKMVNSEPWNKYVENLWNQVEDVQCPHRLYLVSTTEHAFNLKGNIPAAQFIRIHEKAEEERQGYLGRILTHELCRLLLNRTRIAAITQVEFSSAPVKLFISHAKSDGLTIAEAIRDYIYQKLPLKAFFDAVDIAIGYSFQQEIQANMEDAALLVIQTDAYSSREWCRREVISAKQLGIPIVVANAIIGGEERSFPYLGNIPTIRWNRASLQRDAIALKRNIESTIDLMLSEVLRRVYWRHYFADLCSLSLVPQAATCLSRPPELLDLIRYREASDREHTAMLVYPDPPLGNAEAELLSSFVPRLKLRTPILIWSGL